MLRSIAPLATTVKEVITIEKTAAPHSLSNGHTHVSDTPPPVGNILTQSTEIPGPAPAAQLQSERVPAATLAPQNLAQDEEKATTEYTWPDSAEDVDMVSGEEPRHTTLLPDRNVTKNPAVQRALTSLALGRMMEQDQNDILIGVPLPIISEPMLPSLIPINEEELLLFSSIKPLQGDALVRAAGITKDDLPPMPSKKGKGKAHWSIPVRVHLDDDTQSAPTQEPVYSVYSPSETYEDVMLSQGLKKMSTAFPDLPEEHLTIALQRHDNNLPTALTWLQSAVDMNDMRGTLLKAFPSMEEVDVKNAVKEFKGDFVLSFNRLAATYDCTSDWDNVTYVR